MTASVTVTNSVDAAELNGRGAVTTTAIVAAAVNSLLMPTAAAELRTDNSNNKYTTAIMNVYGNRYSHNTSNNSTIDILSAAASIAGTPVYGDTTMQLDNSASFAYNESSFPTSSHEQDAINRSLLLFTTAVTSITATASATATATNDTHQQQQQIVRKISDEDWAHFYDLVLSWQGICLIAVFCTFIVITIIGNTLVILSVITTRRLKTVTNCFVMSLAVADLLVGIFVMPPAVAVHLLGSWQLGWILCDIWISLDILLCTASILSLCAISVDRYLAVTQPLTYSRKRRSKRLALIMILIVWVLALVITCPPMFGWYEPGRRDLSECRYNQNEGYVIFSAMGSFFIPMAVMIYVYARISCVIASRHDNMTDISVHNKKFKRYTSADVENDIDHDLSEQELSSGHKKQAAARTLSTQTIAKELHEVMLSEGENGSGSGGGNCSLLGLTTPGLAAATTPKTAVTATLSATGTNPKNGCYELTRPSSFRRTPTASSTMTTLTSEQQHWSFSGNSSGTAATASLGVDSVQLQQQKPQLRQHSVRHQHPHHLSATGAGGILVASPNMDGSTTPASYTTRNTRVHHHHHHHHSKSLSNRITSLKKENKTTQTLSIVVGGFIACWLPFFVYYLITPFLEKHQVSRTLATVLTWLGWFNSAINPFIYAFYSVDFRAAFWRLTCKRFFSASSAKPQFPSNTMSIRR